MAEKSKRFIGLPENYPARERLNEERLADLIGDSDQDRREAEVADGQDVEKSFQLAKGQKVSGRKTEIKHYYPRENPLVHICVQARPTTLNRSDISFKIVRESAWPTLRLCQTSGRTYSSPPATGSSPDDKSLQAYSPTSYAPSYGPVALLVSFTLTTSLGSCFSGALPIPSTFIQHSFRSHPREVNPTHQKHDRKPLTCFLPTSPLPSSLIWRVRFTARNHIFYPNPFGGSPSRNARFTSGDHPILPDSLVGSGETASPYRPRPPCVRRLCGGLKVVD